MRKDGLEEPISAGDNREHFGRSEIRGQEDPHHVPGEPELQPAPVLLGQMGERRAVQGGPRLLLSFAALTGMAFALNMGAMFLVVVHMGEPYLGGDLLANMLVVAPLLGVGTYRAPSLAPLAEVEPTVY